MRISLNEMQKVLINLFVKTGFKKEKAQLLAKVFSESTLMGVNSHGIDRVPLFIENVKKGVVDLEAEAEKTGTFGNIERWDGKLGPGKLFNLNVHFLPQTYLNYFP